jgi:hypothetical protein
LRSESESFREFRTFQNPNGLPYFASAVNESWLAIAVWQAAAWSDHNLKHDARPPVMSMLHSRVYLLLVGFALWFALAVWGFAGGGLSNYLLVIVSGFIFVALQLILSRVGRTKSAAQNDDNQPSLRDWAAGEFDTCQGRLSGAQAALQIVLPIAVAALGMTAFGIVFLIAEHGGI